MKGFTKGTLLLLLGTILSIFLVSKNIFVGKDGGLVFLMFSSCVFGSLFFLILKQNLKKHFGIGFIISLIVYVFYFIFIAASVNTSVINDHIIVVSIIFIIGFYYRVLFVRSKKN